jgi:hypothetical protein
MTIALLQVNSLRVILDLLKSSACLFLGKQKTAHSPFVRVARGGKWRELYRKHVEESNVIGLVLMVFEPIVWLPKNQAHSE